MAKREVTGACPSELHSLRGYYYNTPMYQEHDIPFDTAYCLMDIAYQPEEYDGPQRFCKRRVAKRDPDVYEGTERDEDAYACFCPTHGGDMETHGYEQADKTSAISHGVYAKDENLIMDFTDDEQTLYDSIMEGWPEIYDWPSREEDPARYRILRRVAVNEVRSVRAEDYIDEDGEVHDEPIYNDQGQQVGAKEIENPLAGEYRLLMSEVTNQMKELGLTPKERQKMDSLESQADKDDAISEIAGDALHDGDNDYNPSEFDDS